MTPRVVELVSGTRRTVLQIAQRRFLKFVDWFVTFNCLQPSQQTLLTLRPSTVQLRT